MAIDPLLIPMAALNVPIVIVPTALVMRHLRRSRELKHIERMKALELGRLPEDGGRHSSMAWVSIAIGAGVPVGVFGFSWLATLGEIRRDSEAVAMLWFAAMVVSVFCVWMASKIAGVHLRQPSNSMADVSDFTKVELDDVDAFDVVSRRG